MGVDILSAGLVTPVGYQWASSCAAIRVGIDGFRETRFMFDGDWLRGAPVSLPDVGGGREHLLRMAAMAVDECMGGAPGGAPSDMGLAISLAEPSRPGRYEGLGEKFVSDLVSLLKEKNRFASAKVFESGAVGGADALGWADQGLRNGTMAGCVVVGVDTFLHGPTLAAYHAQRRLVTAENADGFLPGEAAAALCLGPLSSKAGALQMLGLGWGRESAIQDSGIPLRADGLVQAYRAAMTASSCGYDRLDYRIADASGDQYAFKEMALALTRTMRVRKEFFDVWHPSDCVGRVGAAAVPLIVAVALAAARRRYAPGPGALCHVGDDEGRRAAFVLRERTN